MLEASPRPIGGLCARVLRFGPQRISLEELLVRHALGLPGSDLDRESAAAGVMMIPVPVEWHPRKSHRSGPRESTPGIEAVEITAREHDAITAWPEGSSDLGFIFARGEDPVKVERSCGERMCEWASRSMRPCRWRTPRRAACLESPATRPLPK